MENFFFIILDVILTITDLKFKIVKKPQNNIEISGLHGTTKQREERARK